MAEVRKILGQAALAATTLTSVYAVPTGLQAVGSIFVCNRGAATTFRLSLAVAAAADATSQYINYDTALAANATQVVRGVCLGSLDVVRAYAGAATVTVTVIGVEIG